MVIAPSKSKASFHGILGLSCWAWVLSNGATGHKSPMDHCLHPHMYMQHVCEAVRLSDPQGGDHPHPQGPVLTACYCRHAAITPERCIHQAWPSQEEGNSVTNCDDLTNLLPQLLGICGALGHSCLKLCCVCHLALHGMSLVTGSYKKDLSLRLQKLSLFLSHGVDLLYTISCLTGNCLLGSL